MQFSGRAVNEKPMQFFFQNFFFFTRNILFNLLFSLQIVHYVKSSLKPEKLRILKRNVKNWKFVKTCEKKITELKAQLPCILSYWSRILFGLKLCGNSTRTGKRLVSGAILGEPIRDGLPGRRKCSAHALDSLRSDSRIISQWTSHDSFIQLREWAYKKLTGSVCMCVHVAGMLGWLKCAKISVQTWMANLPWMNA